MHLGNKNKRVFLYCSRFSLFFGMMVVPCKGGGMFGWHCLEARIQAMTDEQNTNDDSRNHLIRGFQCFLLL